MLRVAAFANAVAIMDLVLHPGIHLWARFAPRSYEWLMGVFVAGVRFEVKAVDSSPQHIVLGGLLEAAILWAVAAAFALLYNRLAAPKSRATPTA
jgi:hypothetical protein